MQAGPEYTRHMGKYPVINLTLKSAKQPDFESAYYTIQAEIAAEFERHRASIEHGRDLLSAKAYEQYISIADETANQTLLWDALKLFCKCMNKVTGTNTIILIDEYDVPLKNAISEDFTTK